MVVRHSLKINKIIKAFTVRKQLEKKIQIGADSLSINKKENPHLGKI